MTRFLFETLFGPAGWLPAGQSANRSRPAKPSADTDSGVVSASTVRVREIYGAWRRPVILESAANGVAPRAAARFAERLRRRTAARRSRAADRTPRGGPHSGGG